MPTWVDKLLNSQFVQLGLAALAFLIALWLVVVIARMLMGGRLRLPGGRTRQARLGIVDAFDLDRQRQLIIVRRDNTEHLIMIGGPNDLVIESEIVRVEARDIRDVRRDKISDNGDLRVPAPAALPALDGFPPGGVSQGPRAEEPLLPMPLPAPPEPAEMPARALEPSATRGPTFPLPPRRPAPPSPVDRRPPPGIPDRASRADEGSAPVRQDIAATDANTPGTPDPSGRPAPLPRPLPPRTPIRPLKRTTPQAEPGQAPQPQRIEPAMPPPLMPAPPTPAPAAVSGVRPSPPPPAKSFPAAAPVSAPPPEDGLESLEEEMAKLLGR